MRRSGRKYQPHLPPIRKIVLPEKFSKWRLVLLIVLLVDKLGDNLRMILDPYSAQE